MDGKDAIRNLIMTVTAEVRSVSSKESRNLAMRTRMEGFVCCEGTCVLKKLWVEQLIWGFSIQEVYVPSKAWTY